MSADNIAVVGSKGFIGRHLVRYLQSKGYNVLGIDLPEYDITDIGSLLLDDVFNDFDVVYHLAVMNLAHCKNSRRGCVANNVIGTVNVMEAAVKAGVKRVIYSSASSVYGDPVRMPVREDDPKNPITLYGATKLASENIIRTYTRGSDLTSVIFRFTNVYGPGQSNGLIPSLLSNLSAGLPVTVTGDGEQSRDFVYVDDVVEILTRAIETPMYSSVFNLGSGVNTRINEVVSLCACGLGVELDVDLNTRQKYNSKKVIYTMAEDDRKEFRADLSGLKRVYGDLILTTFKAGLDSTILWWKNKSDLPML